MLLSGATFLECLFQLLGRLRGVLLHRVDVGYVQIRQNKLRLILAGKRQWRDVLVDLRLLAIAVMLAMTCGSRRGQRVQQE